MRIVIMGLLLAAVSGCFYRGPLTFFGDPGAMDSLIAAAHECGVREMRIRRTGADAPEAETRLRLGKVRIGSRAGDAVDCVSQWRRAHPELDIGEEILVRG